MLHWNSTNASKKVVWQCKTYVMDGKDACGAKAVDENVLMHAFVRMFNGICEDRQSFIKTMTANIEMIVLQRPDVRETEALAISVVNGYAWIEKLSWEV